jgi:hypothetical protein
MIRHTATKEAPWYVVPADNKWFSRVVVGAAIIDALAEMNLEYPEVGATQLKQLAAARRCFAQNMISPHHLDRRPHSLRHHRQP